jgi:alpha-glucoside transport system substrate-binding protein
MKRTFLMGVAALALLARCCECSRSEVRKPGEDSKFNWKSYDEFKAATPISRARR